MSTQAKILKVIGALPPMDSQVKSKWVDALRSGDYTQARGFLQDKTGGMCCLGVLCDLYHKETGDGKWKTQGTGEVTFDNKVHYAPHSVTSWAGLVSTQLDNTKIFDDTSELGAKGTISNTFGQMNDELGYSFDDIADFVENNL